MSTRSARALGCLRRRRAAGLVEWGATRTKFDTGHGGPFANLAGCSGGTGLVLERARALRTDERDSALLDRALNALLERHRAGEIDAAYAAYERTPIEQVDEWGDLAAFRRAAGAT